MNIYLNVEISVRELDSKLLLATIAASRGHQVIVSDMSGIDRGFRGKLFAPGIFHTKCITPFAAKIAFHQTLIDNGFLVTSIDEEGGLDISGYDEFSKTRYSEKTIEQSSAVFVWGQEDLEGLKRTYPNHTSKIYITGSPRVDLWRPSFSDYWKTFKRIPNKPFLLIPSNLTMANISTPFHQLIKYNKILGYYQRKPELLKRDFNWASEDYLMTYSFIEAIKHLAKNLNGFDIVLRPHPAENLESWETYLDGIPNIHVIREDSISFWIKQAFAVMHSGCTSAIESIISEKPVISYEPFPMKYRPSFTNNLGYRVESLENLSKVVNEIFKNSQSKHKTKSVEPSLGILSKKIYHDENELAAEKIVKIWESLNNNQLSRSSNWRLCKWLLKTSELKDNIGRSLRKFFPARFDRFREDYKFKILDKVDITERVSKLQKKLGIDKKLKCELLSSRTILIR